MQQFDLMGETKRRLAAEFQVKRLGSLRSFIGWEIMRTTYGIYIHQGNYIKTSSHILSSNMPVTNLPLYLKLKTSTKQPNMTRPFAQQIMKHIGPS